MKKFAVGILTLTTLLASCGQPATVPDDAASSSQTVSVPATTYSPEQAATYFVRAGVSKDRLEQMQLDLQSTAQYIERQRSQQLSAQSTDNLLSEIQTLSAAIDLAKTNTTPESVITSQAYTRSLVIQATQNIALNSLANFEYYQARLTYSPPLDYNDDKCSSPLPLAGNVTFSRACDQHDFGYRNGAFWRETHNSAYKGSVDAAFNTNMFQLCREKWGSTGQNYTSCTDQASLFFVTVKAIFPCLDNANLPTCWPTNYKDGTTF